MPHTLAGRTPAAQTRWLDSLALSSAVAAIYLSAAVYLLYVALARPLTGMDDANIFFVYARHFVHGQGIVYAVGGPHVEGFTSFLYFLLCSACYLFTGNPETLLLLLNTAFAIAATVLVMRAMNAIGVAAAVPLSVRLALMAALVAWVLINPCFFAWNVISLMDAGLYGLVLAWAYFLVVQAALGPGAPNERLQACLAVAALVLVRPEGLLWAALVVSLYCWLRGRAAWLPLAVGGATVAVLEAFRLLYFGFPFPNTFYAKVSLSPALTLHDGWLYTLNFLEMYGAAAALPLVVALSAILYARWRRTVPKPLMIAALVTVSLGAFVYLVPLLEGGDHFYALRLYQPGWLLLGACLLLPVVMLRELRSLRSALIYLACCAAAVAATDRATWAVFEANNRPFFIPPDFQLNVFYEFAIAADGRENGRELGVVFAGDLPSVGFAAAGGMAYGYPGRVYDLMGLNEPRMAHADKVKSGPKGHQSFDEDVFLQIAPDVLMPRAVPVGAPVSLEDAVAYYTNPAGWDNLIFKNLFNDPRFRSAYVMALVSGKDQPAYKCYGYFNRVYLARLAASGKFDMAMIPS
jgi:arabinofuranosyltransferase